MKGKSALFALAVVLLMGTMGGVALADYEQGNLMYGPADSFDSAHPSRGLDEAYVGEIREPVETGALPDGPVVEDSVGTLNMDVFEQNSSPDFQGLPDIQDGE